MFTFLFSAFSFLKSQILPLIIKHWRIFLVLLMVLAIFYYKTRYTAIVSEFEAYKLKQAVQVAEIKKKQAEEAKRRAEIDNFVKSNYEEAIKNVEQYYKDNPNVKYVTVDRLLNNSCAGRMPTTTQSTERASESTQGTAEAIINRDALEKEIIQCRSLIEWVNAQDR